jgi:hypothetical protein
MKCIYECLYRWIGELIFLGTGTSAGTPRPKCVINPDSECTVCRDAVTRGPSRSRNWRGNPSLLIRYRAGDSDTTRNIQVSIPLVCLC